MAKKRKNGFYWVLSFHDTPCIARFTTPDNWFVPGDPEVYGERHFKEVTKDPVTQGHWPDKMYKHQ